MLKIKTLVIPIMVLFISSCSPAEPESICDCADAIVNIEKHGYTARPELHNSCVKYANSLNESEKDEWDDEIANCWNMKTWLRESSKSSWDKDRVAKFDLRKYKLGKKEEAEARFEKLNEAKRIKANRDIVKKKIIGYWQDSRKTTAYNFNSRGIFDVSTKFAVGASAIGKWEALNDGTIKVYDISAKRAEMPTSMIIILNNDGSINVKGSSGRFYK